MKNVIERGMENRTAERIETFRLMQQQDYQFKVAHAEETAWRFFQHPEISGRCYVAVGGLDSLTLLLFLRRIGIRVPAVSVSALEDKSIQKIHRQLGVQALMPLKNNAQVIRQFGWPVLSKEIAGKSACCKTLPRKMQRSVMPLSPGKPGNMGDTAQTPG